MMAAMSEKQVSEVRTPVLKPKSNLDQRLFLFKATYVIWLLFVMLEALIALRFGLKLIGANADSGFATLIYGLSGLFLIPFSGLLPTYWVGAFVLEISSLIAIVVYALLFWGFERMIWVAFYRPREGPVSLTQRTSNEQHTE
jgi:hypothetical protein